MTAPRPIPILLFSALSILASSPSKAESSVETENFYRASLVESAERDSVPIETKRSNAGIYSRHLDRALSVLRSTEPDSEKRAELHRLVEAARDYRNARDGEYSDLARSELDLFDRWIDGNHFFLLETSLVAARLAIGSFR